MRTRGPGAGSRRSQTDPGPADPRTASALRAAVGYLGAGLSVTVLLCGAAGEVLEVCARPDAPPALLRPLTTLRALGHAVRAADEGALAAALAAGASLAIVRW